MTARTVLLRSFFLALLAAALAGCAPSNQDQEIEFRVPVFAREVETGTVEDRVVATGSLRAEEGVALR